MNYFNTKTINERTFDFDDYFMQDIVNLTFKGNLLTIRVVNRNELKFFDVKFIFTSLHIFESNKVIVLYSLYVKKTKNGFQVNANCLVNGQLHPLDFTAKKIKF